MIKSHSDKFYLAPLGAHLRWILGDLEKGGIYGLTENLFFRPKPDDPFRLTRYGRLMETPVGVAAGPQTQLAQNIVTAWLAGARYLELKTIQVLDELEVAKPCIDMGDEGYNCEWSQELKLGQSFNEYLNAFVIIHILKDKLKIGQPEESGFIFNLSAGYNLAGIQSPAVQRFFDRALNCEDELAAKIEEAAEYYPRAREILIPAGIFNSLTISTMHGCPPEEVEKIGSYFINERGFHTTIKLNPTLLGPEELRSILNERLGYQAEVPDEAFAHDLKYSDGVGLIGRLSREARRKGVEFSLKLTNTLETLNQRQNLPKSEPMVYLSGRALHAVSVNLAARLRREFKGEMDISFSGGADYLNLAALIACDLKPVTVSSDALRPGGYGRISQYLESLGEAMRAAGAGDIPAFIESPGPGRTGSALGNLNAYAAEVLADPRYKKGAYTYKNGVKTERPLTRFNCAAAPCQATCPASQDIPRYLRFTAGGEYDKAYRTILATNPFPNVQGAVCDHRCQFKCSRLNYDQPLKIREIKRFVAERNTGAPGLVPRPPSGLSAAVAGAGPAGLSAAYYLALAGFKVEIFEAGDQPGGMAGNAIPPFRLNGRSLAADIDNILSLGIGLNLNHRVDAAGLEKLRRDFDYVCLTIGAQAAAKLGLPGEEAEGVMDQLSFLRRVRRGLPTGLGRRVIVLGAGNSAMDAARAALRLGSDVTVVYRRTRREMPAAGDEIREALEEGVKLMELTAPEKILVADGRALGLLAVKMELGEADADGRARPVRVEGSEFDLPADSVIVAIGQDICLDAWPEKKLAVDPETGATQLAGVYAGGDVGRGASSLIEAIGDGRSMAMAICRAAGLMAEPPEAPARDQPLDTAALRRHQARRGRGPEPARKAPADRLDFQPYIETFSENEAREEAARCLQCDLVCNVCSTVCPNRANLAVPAASKNLVLPLQSAVIDDRGQLNLLTRGRLILDQAFQIVNLGDFCNECGNCAAFCPTRGAPYLDKYRVHLSKDSYDHSRDGFHFYGPNLVLIKRSGVEASLEITKNALIYKNMAMLVELAPSKLEARKVVMFGDLKKVSLEPAAEAAVVWNLLKDHPLFEYNRRI